jgi:hypothetical protein
MPPATAPGLSRARGQDGAISVPTAREIANWLPNFHGIGAFRGAKTPRSYDVGELGRCANDNAASRMTSVANP